MEQPETHQEEVAIGLEQVSKCFHIYDRPIDRLKDALSSRVPRRSKAGFRKRCREFWALKDVSFRICRGETVAIVGRNGSGKSTLLQVIVGTLKQTSGETRVNGRVSALLELGAGFNPEFTGRENVFLSAAILGVDRRQIESSFKDIEEFADIGDFIDQPVKTYSSGMYVRLAFSVSIHVSPDVLVVDEALAVGDTAFQTKCLTRIRDMQEQGATIVLVTHSANTVIEYCDRAIYLRRGRMIMDSDCRSVLRRYANDLVEEEGNIGITKAGERTPVQVRKPTKPLKISSDEATPEASSDKPMVIDEVTVCGEDGTSQSAFSFGETGRVKIRVRVNKTVASPCFGMQIKSTDDIVLWSGTTHHMRMPVEKLEAGQYCIDWRIRMNFSGNRYVLAIGAGQMKDGEYRRSERLAYAGHFDVFPKNNDGYGWLAPDAEFSIESQNEVIES